MITNFEDITYELTEFEENIALPTLMDVISQFEGDAEYTGDIVSSGGLVRLINARILADSPSERKRITDVRLRKLINYIRSNAMLPICSNSRGYFVSNDPEVLKLQIQSLRERSRSIDRCADGLEKIMRKWRKP
jgi:hypothetical protein